MAKKRIEDTYKKLTQQEHVLTRPDTYVGSTEPSPNMVWVANQDYSCERKEITFSPAFLKIFDEILTNASDHAIRTGKVKKIEIEVNSDYISVKNDGPGIPVEEHKEEKLWVPEMIFGHLLTGSNYDDSEDRMVGGRNGLGAKLTNIFSTKFIVKTRDGKKHFSGTWKDNMGKMSNKRIKDDTGSPFTEIKYYPEWSRFGMDGMDDDVSSLLLKRAMDIAAFLPKVKVRYNKKEIPVKNFQQWMKLHLPEDSEVFYEQLDENWTVGLAPSPTETFESVSVVNGVSTYKGGTHVNWFSLESSKALCDQILKGKSKIRLSWAEVKTHLFAFVCCNIPNPTFDSQTKENLTNRMTSNITPPEPSQKFIKKVSKSSVVQSIMEWVEAREQARLKRELASSGSARRVKIDKLEDAHKAGTAKSSECFLFLTEGDSAKSSCLAGFSEVGRDYYGAFALKGKPLNVREAQVNRIVKNKEVSSIVSALGLTPGKKYTSLDQLRYGKLVFFTDADVDGAHIKGLLLNLIAVLWPELLKMDFLYEFITPIIVATKGKKRKEFYQISEYSKWIKASDEYRSWDIKYYKGLGTIKSSEVKIMFNNLEKHLIPFNYDDGSEDKLDMVFSKKRADDRRNWLTTYGGEKIVEKINGTSIGGFIDEEMIQFSMADNIRSIPSMYDGLKPSQRKVLHTVLKRNIVRDTKVAQLAPSVAEFTQYHHGEGSLEQTIVGMAQDFTGSGNLNYLLPQGQFGTRDQGGKDNAASRYIFTCLNPITRNYFMAEDDDILDYLEEEGKTIEPETFAPVIPTLLLNGAQGIGTGWSTEVPCYKSDHIAQYIRYKLGDRKSKPAKLKPYYENFKGEIEVERDNSAWYSHGVFDKLNTTTVEITELPIGTWTNNYVNGVLEKALDEKIIKEYINDSTDVDVKITLKFSRETLAELWPDDDSDDFAKKFKLVNKHSLNNMHAFKGNAIVKFDTPEDVIDQFIDWRIDLYEKRRQNILEKLTLHNQKLDNMVRFILAVVDGKLELRNKKKDVIVKAMGKLGLDEYEGSYSYLLNMSMSSLTKEKVDELKKRKADNDDLLKRYSSLKPENMWLSDLSKI